MILKYFELVLSTGYFISVTDFKWFAQHDLKFASRFIQGITMSGFDLKMAENSKSHGKKHSKWHY